MRWSTNAHIPLCSSVEGLLGLALVGKACFGGRVFSFLLGGSRATDVGVTLEDVCQLSCMEVTCVCVPASCVRDPRFSRCPPAFVVFAFGTPLGALSHLHVVISVSILSVSSETFQTGSLDAVPIPCSGLPVVRAPCWTNGRYWFPSMLKVHVPDRLPPGCFAKNLGSQVSVLGLRFLEGPYRQSHLSTAWHCDHLPSVGAGPAVENRFSGELRPPPSLSILCILGPLLRSLPQRRTCWFCSVLRGAAALALEVRGEPEGKVVWYGEGLDSS